MQALLAHSLPAPLETQPQPAKPMAAIVNRPDPSSLDLPINVGMPEGSVVAAAPTRVIESMPGGVYVSHLSDEYITLGFRYTLLDD
jgi:hypothetical protein